MIGQSPPIQAGAMLYAEESVSPPRSHHLKYTYMSHAD